MNHVLIDEIRAGFFLLAVSDKTKGSEVFIWQSEQSSSVEPFHDSMWK